jgi:hypothetical protein
MVDPDFICTFEKKNSLSISYVAFSLCQDIELAGLPYYTRTAESRSPEVAVPSTHPSACRVTTALPALASAPHGLLLFLVAVSPPGQRSRWRNQDRRRGPRGRGAGRDPAAPQLPPDALSRRLQVRRPPAPRQPTHRHPFRDSTAPLDPDDRAC